MKWLSLGVSRRYEVGQRIGRGGMAEVFRALRVGPDGFSKDVVVKRMLPVPADLRTLYENYFRAEGRLAAKLPHQNITQVLDYYVDDGVEHLVLEWVNGCDVAALIDQAGGEGLLTVDIAVFIAAEALRGLHFAHQARIDGIAAELIHRDVSPHNLLVSRSGEVKLSDFGIAKAKLPWREQTVGNAFRGKIAYAAPECFNEAQAIDRRVDIYAMGVVLWEMLTGATPFPSGAPGLLAKQQGNLPSLETLSPSVPRALVDVITRMLSPRREDRPSTAQEARALLLAAVPTCASGEDALAQLVLRVVGSQSSPAPLAIADAATEKSPQPTVQAKNVEGRHHAGAMPILNAATVHANANAPREIAETAVAPSVRPGRPNAVIAYVAGITIALGTVGVTTAFLFRDRDAAAVATTVKVVTREVFAPALPVAVVPPAVPTVAPASVAVPVAASAKPRRAARTPGSILVHPPETEGAVLITIDGVDVGAAPKRYEISAGYHRITLAYPDGRSSTQRLLVEPDATAVVRP